MVRMIVTDLDGSLVPGNKIISDYTIDIFGKCRDKGIVFTFATARVIKWKRFYEVLKPDAVIYNNGSAILADNQLIGTYRISSKITKNILEKIKMKCPESTLSVRINDVLYTDFDMDDSISYTNIKNMPDGEADRIIIGGIPEEKIMEMREFIPKNMTLEIDFRKFGVITNKKATKWNGIKKLSEFYGIKTESIVSFGDDTADMEMIRNCGIGVAMENGKDKVKSIAKHICKSNENDGIAQWIEKSIL